MSHYQTLPFRSRPREKLKKDETPDVTTDAAFEPAVIYKMLNNVRDNFTVEGRQEDAEEFLTWILNKMNDEIIEVSEFSLILIPISRFQNLPSPYQ